MKSPCLVLGGIASAALVFACSPAADPVGKAAVHFQIRYPTDPTAPGTCDNPGIGGVGDPPPSLPSGADISNLNDVGLVTDGQSIEGSTGNYVAKCKVTGSDSHDIDIEIQGPNQSPLAGNAMGQETNITIRGSLDSDGTGQGQVAVGIPDTGTNSPRDGFPCTFTAVADDGDSDKFLVEGGSAVFTFFCPQTESSISDFGTCETAGSVVVENCLD